jgi:myo-inositol catabolism protein IolS
MKMRRLGNTEIEISTILMGTWQAGKTMWVDIDDNETHHAIRAAFDAGITTFDTAEVYGDGHSEHILGKALSGLRDRAVIATKVFSNHLEPDQIKIACHRSLKNLKTDYIDLYQIHWPPGSFGNAQVPMEEIMTAMNKLKEDGKIRAIGVSNFNRNQMKEVSQYGDIVSLQPPYSLFWRHVEGDAGAYCRDNGLSLLAYSPMAQGLLTGKFGPNHTFAKGDHRASNRLFKPEHFARVQRALARLKPMADAREISLGQLALAWVIAQPNTCAIAGARNAEQSVMNAAAGDITLSDEDLVQLNDISRLVTDHIDDNPVMWKGF